MFYFLPRFTCLTDVLAHYVVAAARLSNCTQKIAHWSRSETSYTHFRVGLLALNVSSVLPRSALLVVRIRGSVMHTELLISDEQVRPRLATRWLTRVQEVMTAARTNSSVAQRSSLVMSVSCMNVTSYSYDINLFRMSQLLCANGHGFLYLSFWCWGINGQRHLITQHGSK